MSKSLVLSLVALLGTTLAVGCKQLSGSKAGSSGPAGASSSPGGAPSDPAVPVAKVNGQVITAGELHAETKGPLGSIESEHAKKVHETRAQALEGMIEKRLIEAKAKAEGLTSEKLIERDVTAKLAQPSDAEVQEVYDRTKASGRPLPPLPEVKADISKFLKERKGEEARREFSTKLRTGAKVENLLPPLLTPKVEVSAEGPSKGEASAPITIVEFSDFECPFCSKAEDAVKQVMETYKGKVRLVFRDYPLPFHPNAVKAAEAAHCAGDQGKYWQMNETLFKNQQALTVVQLKQHAQGLGLDAAKFGKCLDSGEKNKIIEASKKEAEKVGVNGTPAFFVNGRMLSGAQPFEAFKPIIDHELAAASAR